MKGQHSECCNESLSGYADHAVVCPTVPFRTCRHNELCDMYGDFAEEAGATARREAYVPELSSTREAWLDLVAFGTSDIVDLIVDVTVRHPMAERYQPEASHSPSHTAKKAASEKRTIYPARGGRSVITAAAETWGRWGAEAEALLTDLASAAARRDRRSGRVPGPRLARWRAQLDGALHRAVATSLMVSRFGPPGRSLRRKSCCKHSHAEEFWSVMPPCERSEAAL